MEDLKEKMRGSRMVLSVILALLLLTGAPWMAFAKNDGNGPGGTLDVSGANKWHVQNQEALILRIFDLDETLFEPVNIKTSATGDLVIEVHSECAVGILDLDLLQAANGEADIDFDAAIGLVKVGVYVDGELLEPGFVNFCDRSVFELSLLFQQLCSINLPPPLPDPNVCVNTFNASLDIFSTAAGFKWFTRNVGNGVHEVKIKAKIIGIPIDLGGIVFGALRTRNLTIFTDTTLQDTTP